MKCRSRRVRERVVPALIACSSWALLSYSALSQSTRGEERQKIAQTTDVMKRLCAGLFGAPNGVGYIGDMGALPASLETLATTSASPAYSTANQGSVGMGFNGPYVPRVGVVSSVFVDAWNTPLALVAGSRDVRIRSAGPDRDAATEADNVYYPLAPRTTHGTIEAIVTSVTAGESDASPLDDNAVDVRVYYASNGTESSAPATYTGSNGVFQLEGVHVGRHYVSVTAKETQDYDVSSASDTLLLRGRKVSATFQLVDKGKISVCHKPGQANLTLQVPPAALDAHIKHGDTMGSCAGDEDKK